MEEIQVGKLESKEKARCAIRWRILWKTGANSQRNWHAQWFYLKGKGAGGSCVHTPILHWLRAAPGKLLIPLTSTLLFVQTEKTSTASEEDLGLEHGRYPQLAACWVHRMVDSQRSGRGTKWIAKRRHVAKANSEGFTGDLSVIIDNKKFLSTSLRCIILSFTIY